MRKIFVFIMPLLIMASCMDKDNNPYAPTLCTLTLSAQYPEGSAPKEGVAVRVEDINLGSIYSLTTDASGKTDFKLPAGLYRAVLSEVRDEDIFNGSVDNIELSKSVSVAVPLEHSRTGRLVVKEIYCGGCMKTPEQGNYQFDKYIIIHNNFHEVQYLDSLCFGTLYPWGATGSNPFLSGGKLPDYLPLGETVWQFGGSGKTFPLQPGEDAVICINGAINHAAKYPLSVNLDKEKYFVCYSPTYFYNTSYHPAPGPNIRTDHYLEAIIKTGKSNAYPLSMSSPTIVVFHQPEGMTMKEYLATEGALVQIPGSSTLGKVSVVKPEWVADAVEVFDGSSSKNQKRMLSGLDAGYATLSATKHGKSLMRHVDEELSQILGYEVLEDTNNSLNDFYESEKASLHE